MKRVFMFWASMALVLPTWGVNIIPQSELLASAAVLAQRQVPARMLLAPGLPISIDNPKTTLADGRGLSHLFFSVKNNSKSEVVSFDVAVYILDQNNQVKSGEGWRQNERVLPGRSKELQTVLKNGLMYGDSIVVTILDVSSWKQRWRLNSNNLIDSIRAYADTDTNDLPTVESSYEPIGGGGGEDICDARLRQAKNACSNGISSFSCDPTTGQFSFTCR